MSFDSRRSFSPITRIFVAAFLVVAMLDQRASAQTLVTSPFVTGFEGWQDTYVSQPTQVGGAPSWGVLLTPDPISTQRFLMETGDGREADGVAGDGQLQALHFDQLAGYDTGELHDQLSVGHARQRWFWPCLWLSRQPQLFSSRIPRSGHRFRLSTRHSVQKVVGGVITQLGTPSLVNVPLINGTPFEAKVVVTGTSYDIQTNTSVGGTFTSILSGSDAESADWEIWCPLVGPTRI